MGNSLRILTWSVTGFEYTGLYLGAYFPIFALQLPESHFSIVFFPKTFIRIKLTKNPNISAIGPYIKNNKNTVESSKNNSTDRIKIIPQTKKPLHFLFLVKSACKNIFDQYKENGT